MPTSSRSHPRRMPSRLPFWVAVCLFALVALFFLWQEHNAHPFGATILRVVTGGVELRELQA
jgi:hypothetical protein